MALPPRPDPEGHGLHTLDDSVEDIRSVVEDACARYDVSRLTLFGSSRGAIQVLTYAATDSSRLSLAILNNPSVLCYVSGATEGPALAVARTERLETRRSHTYKPYTAEYQRERWRNLFHDEHGGGGPEIVDDKIQEAYIEACLQTDREGCRGVPPVFRVPTESIPDRVPLVPLDRLEVPVLVVEAEEISSEHVQFLIDSAPAGRIRWLRIHDSNHFTLRNTRRFELANVIDVAVSGMRWGARRG
jgi:pimeloyl-ACP methyl ester carboxylesterase